jgi:DNA polymerase
MNVVRLANETDFRGWRAAARALLAAAVPPEEIEWVVGDAGSLFVNSSTTGLPAGDAAATRVPPAFLRLCETAILHRDPQRFGTLYRLLFRLRDEPRLLQVASDPDVARARAMQKAVNRDIHKMHAYVRFRRTEGADGPIFVAWFEPSHFIVEAAAPFFARRFASMRWSVLTPDASAWWDGESLHTGPGVDRSAAPDDDALEALWRTYYGSIFNPARLKVRTMQAHMPRKYWTNLPEAALIPQLVRSAAERTHAMVEAEAREPRRRIQYAAPGIQPVAEGTLPSVRAAAATCRRCPLWAHATQTVFGEGPEDAPIVFVGEQPGDREDLAGAPFVGPAGALLDRALASAGIPRDAVYLTNAVKHFKFEPRGKRRLHRTPGQLEVEACGAWLERELALLKPQLVVALGATATRALTGRSNRIEDVRGRVVPWKDGTQLLVTVHPAAILRAPAETQDAGYARFLRDIELAAPFVEAVPARG